MMSELIAPLSSTELAALGLSLRVAVVAVICALPVAILLAWILARFRFPGFALLNGLIHLPLVLPPVVTGYALLLLFGRNGPIGSALESCCGIVFAFRWTGAALAAGIMALPLMVRAIRISIEHVDRHLEDAARTLGVNRLVILARITLPLSLPGLLAGATLGFAKALGEFGATITFVSNIPGETQTLPSAIYALIQTPGGDPGALRLAILAVLVSMGALILSERLAHKPFLMPRR